MQTSAFLLIYYFVPIASSDYTSASGVFVITEDNTQECLSISIIDDNEDEGERECFAVTISTASAEGISLGISLATVCITDDDGSAHTL